jgi:pyruvate formate-lyase/glycerol dehydratase family glycyl radical enzyme
MHSVSAWLYLVFVMARVCDSSVGIWQPSTGLTSRMKRLRDEYFAFEERSSYFTNEVRAYTTGRSWDQVYSFNQWGVTPEAVPFMIGFRDSLRALAEEVEFDDELFKLSIAERRAHFFNEVVEKHLPVKILEGELIVGSYFNTALSKVLTQKEQKEWDKGQACFYKELKLRCETGEFNYGAIPGHLVPNYQKVLQKGFKGIQAELRELLNNTKNPKHQAWLKALILSCETPRILSERYSTEAQRMSEEITDPKRREELKEIARICSKVPWEPAETFWEAVQSLWMTHMLVMAAESYPGPGTSPGRIDQYLFPYYERDIKQRKLTQQFAREILECYWLKHNYAYDFQARVGNSQGINSSFGQLITIGGINNNHEDASNDLTWLILDVIEEMNLLEPKPNIRLHAKTPVTLMRRVAQMIAQAQGSPFLMNFDELSMKGLVWQGVPEEEVWDYAPVGCLENTMIGCDVSGTVDVNPNIAKAVELVFSNGKDMRLGTQLGPKTGNPLTFKTFDQFFNAFKTQLKALLDRAIQANNFADELRVKFEPVPYLSLLIDGCAESGKDCRAGGTKYNFITVEALGLATAADSITAVQKLVFEDRKITMGNLLQALQTNFEGYEELRQMLINHAPKFGNDVNVADQNAREISRFWGEYVFQHIAPASGRRYRGGYLSWNYFISFAPYTSATPDGRRRGEYLSNGVCPAQGRDAQGPTAAAISVGKLGLEVQPNGSSHTMTFSPASLRDEEHLDKLVAFLRTYGKVGGTALQTNVITPETLRNAQETPDEYRNLLVRVTGYNAYFTTLGKEQQDEIINRTSHHV